MTIPGPSKTEQILSAVETLLAATYGIATDPRNNLPRVYRGRAESVARAEIPTLEIDAIAELSNSKVINCRILCTLLLRIRIHIHGGASTTQADPIRCSIHSLLFADKRLGGLTVNLRRAERRPSVEWEDLRGDNQPGVVDVFYEYEFYTLEGDLTS